MNKAKGRLEGKVAIVTGAGAVGPGWGNGRATTVRFAAEGARVLAVDKDAGAMEETLARAPSSAPSHTLGLRCHRQPGRRRAGDGLPARFGGIDILVNNVGGAGPRRAGAAERGSVAQGDRPQPDERIPHCASM